MRDVLQQTVKSRVESAFGKPKLNTKIILKERNIKPIKSAVKKKAKINEESKLSSK